MREKQMQTSQNIYKKKKPGRIPMYVFLLFYTVISLYPLFFVVVSSFKTDTDIFYKPFSLPMKLSFENYIRAWKVSHISQYFQNSVIMAIISCILLVFLGSTAAYAISKFQFKLKNPVYIYFLIGMMIPAQSTILPLAFDIGKMHIHDSLASVILILTAFQIPFALLVFSGMMSTIPDALEEAAIIDGSGAFYVYTRIILPLSTPAIVTVVIFNFLAAWNNVLFPLIFLNREESKPIAIGLLSFFGQRK
jgi:raffinose/stachyose/melibiose transport system permease protein